MIKIFYITLFLITSLSISAQKKVDDGDFTELVLNLSSVYNNAKILIGSACYNSDSATGLWYEFLIDNNITQRKNEININTTSGISDLGLKWTSEVNSNFKKNVSDTEDIFSRFRISSGIDWSIWGDDSFMKRRSERQSLAKKQNRDSYRKDIKDRQIDLKNKYNTVHDVFDAHRLINLKEYQSLLKKEYEHKSAMYKKGIINEVDLAETEHEMNNVQYSIDFIDSYLLQDNKLDKQFKYWNLPIGYTDLPMLSSIENQIAANSQAQLFELEREVAQVEQKESSDFSVKLKLRYNYSEYKIRGGQTYPSVGVTVSVPLNFNTNSNLSKYTQEEKAILFEQEQISLLYELKDKHRHFYSTKKELLVLENDLKHIQVLLNAEKKKESQSQQEFTPTTYIDLSKEFYLKQNEILDKQQELCEEFLSFYLIAGFINDEENLNNINQSLLSIEDKMDDKSTYLWGRFFKEKTNVELLDILVQANINTVFFSPSDSDVAKVSDFIQQCTNSGINVYRLIGENSYASSSNGVQKLLNKLETTLSLGFSGIHLDIEPHTFDDYKINQNKYTERMDSLFIEAKRWCDSHNMSISVSIPMSTPMQTAITLKDNDIESFIMAYENSNQLKLIDRTSKLRETLGHSTAWAIRVIDFQTTQDIKQAIEILNEHGISKLAYYDCSLLSKI